MQKKHITMLVIGILVLLAVYFLFFRKKPTESGYSGKVNPSDSWKSWN